jgi:hypothetical protein
MEKLILTYSWGSEPCGGTDYLPFEYESKDKFVFDILEKYKNHPWEFYGDGRSDFETSSVELFDNVYLTKYDIENIEHSVSTLDEWFGRQKSKLKE